MRRCFERDQNQPDSGSLAILAAIRRRFVFAKQRDHAVACRAELKARCRVIGRETFQWSTLRLLNLGPLFFWTIAPPPKLPLKKRAWNPPAFDLHQHQVVHHQPVLTQFKKRETSSGPRQACAYWLSWMLVHTKCPSLKVPPAQ